MQIVDPKTSIPKIIYGFRHGLLDNNVIITKITYRISELGSQYPGSEEDKILKHIKYKDLYKIIKQLGVSSERLWNLTPEEEELLVLNLRISE